MDNFECVGNNAESEELLAVIATLHHETNHGLKRQLSGHCFRGSVPVYQPLNNGHLGLLELLFGVTASSMRKVDGVVNLDVVVKGDVFYFDTGDRLSAVDHNSSNFGGNTHESPTFQRA